MRTKFMGLSPQEHFLATVDLDSNLSIFDTKKRKFLFEVKHEKNKP